MCFVRARMRVVDEIKSRAKLLHLSFIDFLEALLRVATLKRMPTDEQMAIAGAPSAGVFFLRMHGQAEYKRFLQQHKEHCAATGLEMGQPFRQALEKLLSTLVHTVADQLDGGKSHGSGLELRLNKTKVTNFFKNCGGATSKKASFSSG